MVTHTLSMCDLHLDMDHHDAGFLDYPPSSFSGVSSSYSFASNGPFTPSSGSSTPARHNSMDFGPSFAPLVDNVFTPPLSSVSAYFPLNMKAGDGSDFLAASMPLTPSRNHQLNNGQQMYYTGVGAHLTSPQQMDYYTFHNGLAPSLLAPSPAVQAIQPGNTYDAWSVWEQAESPIFGKFISPSSNSCWSASGVKQEGEMSPISAGGHSYPSPLGKRQLYVEEARQKTTALQMVQRDAPLAPRPTMNMDGDGDVKIEQDSQNAYGPGSILIDPIQRVSAGTNICDYPGCGKTYRRSEHLKRHKTNAHSKVPIWYPCSFCDKKFNRPDNRRQHLGLHAKSRPTKMKGVKYAPKAKAALEEELKNIPRRNKKPKAKHRV